MIPNVGDLIATRTGETLIVRSTPDAQGWISVQYADGPVSGMRARMPLDAITGRREDGTWITF